MFLLISAGSTIVALVKQDNAHAEAAVSNARAVFRIWPDFEVNAFITQSIATVKANAAHTAFSALGDGIVWAVMDSGIDEISSTL